MDSLSREELRRLPYIELKQHAKKQGIKKTNLKAGKLISAILSANSRADETLESFTTCDESLDYSVVDQSQMSHEVSNIGSMSSRRRSRRITQVFSVEKTSEGNRYSSEDSEIEIKSPMWNIGKKTKTSEIGVTSVENKSWSEDSEIELKTPTPILKRSSTFSVEAPLTPVEKLPKLNHTVVDVSSSKIYRPKRRAASAKEASGVLVEKLDISDVQKKTISEDQTCVISENPATVTPRKSILCHGKKSLPVKHGKFRGSKVNFITPDRRLLRRSSNSETPLRSVKDRPKTPIVAKHSVKRKRISSPFPEKSSKHVKAVYGQATPTSSNSITREVKIKLDKGLQAGTPMLKSADRRPGSATSKIRSANFKEIHQKAFDKMEDVEEYHKRVHKRMATLTRSQKRSRKELTPSVKGSKQENNSSAIISNSKTEPVSLKPSRIPQPFRGIPFIPVVKSLRKIDTNFASQAQNQSFMHSTSKNYVRNENKNPIRRCQRTLFTPASASTVFQFGRDDLQENSSSFVVENHTRKKFDLKASLAKKLPYKPHRGILRPLSDSNANQSELNASSLDAVKKKRQESREILKGVRKNRRFELQMSHRGIS